MAYIHAPIPFNLIVDLPTYFEKRMPNDGSLYLVDAKAPAFEQTHAADLDCLTATAPLPLNGLKASRGLPQEFREKSSPVSAL